MSERFILFVKVFLYKRGQGAGRAFYSSGDLKVFYDGEKTKDSCLEVVYRMYWLCYQIHTYEKTQVSLVHGISMGGGASFMVPMKFSIVTEKTLMIDMFLLPQKLAELEKRLISLNSGDENDVRSVVEEFSSEVKLDEDIILNK
ncbi:hypothetical protein K1719_037118 [Acacia pycnantha]|nr:hypothetical protein K1719_037118 [Acacia pycnantha]